MKSEFGYISQIASLPAILVGPRDSGKTDVLLQMAIGYAEKAETNNKLVVVFCGRWIPAIQLSTSEEVLRNPAISVMTYKEFLKKFVTGISPWRVSAGNLKSADVRNNVKKWLSSSVEAVFFDQINLAPEFFDQLSSVLPIGIPWAASYTSLAGEELDACNALDMLKIAPVYRTDKGTGFRRKTSRLHYSDDQVLYDEVVSWLKNCSQVNSTKCNRSWFRVIVLHKNLGKEKTQVREIITKACRAVSEVPFIYGEADESSLLEKKPPIAIIDHHQSMGIQALNLLFIDARNPAVAHDVGQQVKGSPDDKEEMREQRRTSSRPVLKLSERLLKDMPEDLFLDCYVIYQGDRLVPRSIERVGPFSAWRVEVSTGAASLNLPLSEIALDMEDPTSRLKEWIRAIGMKQKSSQVQSSESAVIEKVAAMIHPQESGQIANMPLQIKGPEKSRETYFEVCSQLMSWLEIGGKFKRGREKFLRNRVQEFIEKFSKNTNFNVNLKNDLDEALFCAKKIGFSENLRDGLPEQEMPAQKLSVDSISPKLETFMSLKRWIAQKKGVLSTDDVAAVGAVDAYIYCTEQNLSIPVSTLREAHSFLLKAIRELGFDPYAVYT